MEKPLTEQLAEMNDAARIYWSKDLESRIEPFSHIVRQAIKANPSESKEQVWQRIRSTSVFARHEVNQILFGAAMHRIISAK